MIVIGGGGGGSDFFCHEQAAYSPCALQAAAEIGAPGQCAGEGEGGQGEGGGGVCVGAFFDDVPSIIEVVDFVGDGAADGGAFGDAAVLTIVGVGVGSGAIGDAEKSIFAVPGVGYAVLEGEVSVCIMHGGAEATDDGVLVDVVSGVGCGGSAVDGEGGGGAVPHGIIVVSIADAGVVGGAGDLIGVVVAVGAVGGGAVAEGFQGAASGGVDAETGAVHVVVPADGGAGFFVDATEELTGSVMCEVFADGVFVGEEVESPGFVIGVGGEGWRTVAGDVIELAFGGPGVVHGTAAGGVHLEAETIGIVSVGDDLGGLTVEGLGL